VIVAARRLGRLDAAALRLVPRRRGVTAILPA